MEPIVIHLAHARCTPVQALVSVATRFLVDIPDLRDDVRDSLSLHMAFAHLAVADASQR